MRKAALHVSEVKVLLQSGSFSIVPERTSEGAERGRGEDIPSVPCSRGMGQEGKWLALGNDQEKLMYSSIHGGSGILYAFIKQDNLPVSL